MKYRLALLISALLLETAAIAFEPAPPLPKGPYRGNLFSLPLNLERPPEILEEPPMPKELTALPPAPTKNAAIPQRPVGPLEAITGKREAKVNINPAPPLNVVAPITRTPPASVKIVKGKVVETMTAQAPEKAQKQAPAKKLVAVPKTAKPVVPKLTKPQVVTPKIVAKPKPTAVTVPTAPKRPGLKTLVSQTVSTMQIESTPSPKLKGVKAQSPVTNDRFKPVVIFEVGN